jgi:glycosyltransferase involved in cell wall biosynthesis
MRIGIDARMILSPKKGDAIGVGHYTYQLIRHLLDIDQKNEYVLFFDARVRQKDVRKFSRPNAKIVFYPFSDYKKFLPGAYNEILTAAVLAREDLDVLHVTSTEIRVPSTYRGKMIVTVHDLGIYTVPECYKTTQRMRLHLVNRFMLRKASHVIAVSEKIKDDAQKIVNDIAEKTTVIYSGLDKRFFIDESINGNVIPKKFGITKKYIFFLGTIEPVKNITRLLHAFALFKEARIKKNREEKCDYQLLIAGKPGWLAQDIKNFVYDLQLTKDVRFAGYVIGDELVPLFAHARFFVLPSLYEGFGTTILEAFATGTPAIVSNVGSIPEIAGDATQLVNPIDTKGIAQAMMTFADDAQMRAMYRERGLVRVKDFSWEKTAKETLDVYKEVNGK